MSFLGGAPARVVTLLLLLQAAAIYGSLRKEYVPANVTLARLPAELGDWRLEQEGSVEKEILDVLQADDVLTCNYASSTRKRPLNLFVAYFSSQRSGKAPHSPKNCLPGAGWLPVASDTVTLDIGGAGSMEVSRHVVSHGEQRSLVLYWYQSRDRVVAGEFAAKFYVVADAIRYNRTDTSLVKVTVPMAGKDDPEAMALAQDFVRALFTSLRQLLPS